MPIGWATLIAMFCSAVLVWPVRRVRVVNAVCALAIPLAVAYFAYWLPVWLRPPDLNDAGDLHPLDMYHAWAALEIAILFVPSMLVSLIVVAVAERLRARSKKAQPAP